MSAEHYFPEHALGIMLSGDAQYFTNEGTFVMNAGAICLMRRNHLFRKMKMLGENGEAIALNAFLGGFFDTLQPYIDHPGKLSAKLAELKTSNLFGHAPTKLAAKQL